ncbi:MAG: hypothetical protein SGILL_000973 [Bacillariaceae sp.]
MKAIERKRKEERRRKDRKFFDEMEKNITTSLQRGDAIPGVKVVPKAGSPNEPMPKSRVRTISGMDDVLLAELRDDNNVQERLTPQEKRVHERRSSGNRQMGRPPLPLKSGRTIANNDDDDLLLSPDIDEKSKKPLVARNSDSELSGVKFVDAPIHNEKQWRELGNEMLGNEVLGNDTISPPPGHTRRNTGGTIYLQHTMINPDIQATIKCVCGVYRAHIVQATKKTNQEQQQVSSASQEYSAFNDLSGSTRSPRTVPLLSEVTAFYDAFYRRSQMEHDTIITSIIYVERVIKCTSAALTPNPENWRSLLFACMVLASKVWDDLSMWNVDFSNVSAHTAGLSSFTLRRINQLELELLKSLKFDVRVPAGEYAKYYFLIRTMLLRSGLVKEDEKPLQKRDAFRKLEKLTSTFLKQSKPETVKRDRRSKSMDDSISTSLASSNPLVPGPVLKDSVCLEQLVG